LHEHGLDTFSGRFLTMRDGRYVAVTYIYPRGPLDLAALGQVVKDVDPRLQLTGLPVVNAELARRAFPEFLKGVSIGEVIVTLLIYAVFRSVPYTLLALLPTAVGFVWAGGLLALVHLELDLFSLFAAVTFIGISVDYGIYILYRRVVEQMTDMGEVVARTGPAIVIACVTALIGFGTLVDSSYGPLQRFGVVSLVTLSCCLVASVVLLPALVIQMDRWSRPAR
jgi:predicted RND superfamily exporter protein